MKWARILILCLSSLVPTVAVAADVRVALVIGNSAYDAVGLLPNPRRDANLVKDALQRDGFAVTMISDATRADMAAALQAFAGQADRADWALVYYAGHGIEVGGVNYLVPTDARLRDDRDAQDEAIALDRVLDAVANVRKLRLVILDACRDNPFAATMNRASSTRSVGRGLARTEPRTGAGILMAYAAAAGAVAEDGAGEHSPFTAAVVSRMREPGLELHRFFDAVTADVLDATQNRQRPYTNGSLTSPEEFYFTPPAPVQQDTSDGRFWALLNKSTDIQTVQSFYDSLQPDNPLRGPVADRLKALREAPAQSAAMAPLPPVPAPKDGEAVSACDRLAASPDDPDRPASVAGVADERVDTNAATVACEKALLQTPNDRRVQFELGRALKIAKRYKDAWKFYNGAAAGGSAAAMYEIGYMYKYGEGLKTNEFLAREWWERSAGGGNTKAMNELGDWYQSGSESLAPNDSISRKWYEKGMKAGDPESAAQLAMIFERGYGVPKNYARARSLFLVAAESGVGWAMDHLGGFYENGLGVTQNYTTARGWYERAVEAGYDPAQESLHRLACHESDSAQKNDCN